jgi:hypothetical protein
VVSMKSVPILCTKSIQAKKNYIKIEWKITILYAFQICEISEFWPLFKTKWLNLPNLKVFFFFHAFSVCKIIVSLLHPT